MGLEKGRRREEEGGVVGRRGCDVSAAGARLGGRSVREGGSAAAARRGCGVAGLPGFPRGRPGPGLASHRGPLR